MTKRHVSFVCSYCGGPGSAQVGHVNRAERLGMRLYCGRKCAAEGRRRRTPEMRAAYMAAYREANREKARQRARDDRAGVRREHVLEGQRASYQRNRETNLERMKAYREGHPKEALCRNRKWRKNNPDKLLLHSAKILIRQATGLRFREIPDDLAAAKVEQLKITRWVREASGIAARSDETRSGSAEGESAAPKGDAR